MRRICRALVLVAAACSTKAPNSSPPTRAPHDVAMPTSAAGAAPAPSDPREERLAKTVVKLLEEDHLLHKQIDDSVSRSAFTTYLDRLDPLKAFLLKSDRDALGLYADKI